MAAGQLLLWAGVVTTPEGTAYLAVASDMPEVQPCNSPVVPWLPPAFRAGPFLVCPEDFTSRDVFPPGLSSLLLLSTDLCGCP